ncbi:hypothetical protein P3S68_021228 [Capsicum galapagoense]
MEKKSNIFELIQAAVIVVGAWKYPAEFKKRKDEILEHVMNPGKVEEDGSDTCVDEKQMEKFQVQYHKEIKTIYAQNQSYKGDVDAEIKNTNKTLISKNCNGGGSRRKIKVSIKRPEEFGEQLKQSDLGDQQGTMHAFITKSCSIGVSRNAATKRVRIAPPASS